MRDAPSSFAPLARQLLPAVVNISTTQTLQARANRPDAPELPQAPPGSPFEEFFRDFFNRNRPNGGPGGPGGGGEQPQRPRRAQSLGSGFVVDASGIVVTNNHVIDGADEINVILQDNTSIRAELLGTDPRTDIAVLRIKTDKPLHAVQFGDSDTAQVGDWVLAIGNPFGLGGTVTAGIVSARGRDIRQGLYDDFIQTDAAINRGNSGGPLFNLDGKVVGINTAIYSPTGGSIGIGFAVPSDTATSVVDQLRQFGETRRGWLGVKIQSVNEETAEALGIKENTGALVASISPSSPAATAGLQTGDVVMKFDGKDVTTMRGLPRLVAQAPIGKTVDIELLRKNERLTKQVVIGRLAEDGDKPEAAEPKDEKREVAPTGDVRQVIGLKLTPLTDDLRKKHGFDRKAKGILIVEIDPQSAAAKKNVRAGDLIVEAAQEPVATVADVQKAVDKVRKAGRKAILLRVEDAKGDLRFIAVPLS